MVSYTPPKKIDDLSVKVMFETELKFLGTHVVDASIDMCDDDQFMRSRSGKKNRRRMRKVKNKIERMRVKMKKRLTSPIFSLKRTRWNDGKRARGNRPRKI